MPYINNLLSQPEVWDSLIVNRRKPHTYRVFTQSPLDDKDRICLHKLDKCSLHESFSHPHPWAGAFLILKGGYSMKVGKSIDRESPPFDVANFELYIGSMYEITNPLTWHAITPIEETYTIMVNSEPFSPEIAHQDCRTTKGKDLDKMPEDELLQHLEIYKDLIQRWFFDYT